jgi:hypothetical protein
MYRLPGPQFTILVALNAMRCINAIYAPKLQQGVELVFFPFKSTSLSYSIFMPLYFQDFRTNCLNGLLFVLFKA